jgi:hypothetical protein
MAPLILNLGTKCSLNVKKYSFCVGENPRMRKSKLCRILQCSRSFGVDTCKFAKVCGVTVPDLLGVLRPHC